MLRKFFDSITATKEISNLNIQATGHMIQITYLLFCAILYLERIIPWDNSFYLFKMIQFDTPDVEHGRWGAAISQLIPYILHKTGSNLDNLIFWYSVSFGIVNYIFFIIINTILNNKKLALAYSLATISLLGYNFFFAMSEIHPAMGILFLYTGLLHSDFIQKPISTIRFYVALFLLCFLAWWLSNTHILSILPFVFVNVHYFMFLGGKKPDLKLIIATIISLLFFVFLILSFKKDSFQGAKLISISDIISVLAGHNSTGVKLLWDDFSKNFWLFDLLLIASLIYLLYQKKQLLAAYLFAGVAGIALIVATYNRFGGNPILDRNYNTIFALITFIVIYRDGFLFRNKWIFNSIVFLLLISSFFRVSKYSTKLTDRISTINRYISNMRIYPERKFVVSNPNIRTNDMWGNWNMTFESLFLSSLKSKDSSLTFCILESKNHEFDSSLLKEPNLLYSVDFAPRWFNISGLPTAYFNIKQTSYRRVNSLQDTFFSDSVFNASNLKIITPPEKIFIKRHMERIVPITIFNTTNTVLPSEITDICKLYLSYHIFDDDGKLINYDGTRTLIEMDIPPQGIISTGLSIETSTLRRGRYTIHVDLLVENKRWFNINKPMEIYIY